MGDLAEKYTEFFTGEYLMGPNSLYLLDELLSRYPLHRNREDTILDLGCGKGLTSLFLAKETGATVYANDLWISGEENGARFASWGVGGQVIPSHEDAAQITFPRAFFDAVVSVDSYHYFAGKPGFFTEKILPFVKPGGMVLIAVPGMQEQYQGRQQELLADWLGEEADLLQSCSRWREIIGCSEETEPAEVWPMECFEPAWATWLSADNPYAAADRTKFESIIRRFTCFVGIAVKKK